MTHVANMTAYVLTFEGAGQRRRSSAGAQMRVIAPEIDWQFVSGFNPDDTRLEQHYDTELNRKYSKRPLSQGEIAVYAGHRKMMQMFLESGNPFGLFFEDDFGNLGSAWHWRHLIANIGAVMADGDMLKLFDFGPPRNGFVTKRNHGPIELIKPRSVGAGAVAYILSRQGAAKILSRERIYRQIDEDIKYFWELGLDIWTARPSLVGEISASLGGSFLEDGRRKIKYNNRGIGTSVKGNYLALRKFAFGRYHQLRQRAERGY
ncbi:glycosyltransferase family 25 protein [Hoeflea sp. TYP-13]|uniref:glycosyltransferase family 25 protein n=1 Tax=Hoeflea sp. TYP-13 TaxID=3230023 RepID=UPI0034C5F145